MMQEITATADAGLHSRIRWLVSDSLELARRRAAHIRQTPEKLLDVTLQPLMFVLLFAFVFGGAIHISGGGYKEYLVGGILVQTIFFGMFGPGISMATDLKEGVLDRFRSLPMSRSAFLFGHVTAELSAIVLAVVIMTASGLIVGWRIDASIASAVAGYGLLMLLAFLAIWLGTLLGIVARSPDAVTGVAFIVIFPLTFISSAFVGTGTLPDGLRQVAEYNPVSAMAAAVRTLFGNPTAVPADAVWPLAHPVVASVLWIVAGLAVVIPVTLRLYRKRTTG
jgi:ABC-2 type transport system permease protein